MPSPFLLAGLVLAAILLAAVLLRRRPGDPALAPPPSAERVALRALAVAAACARAHLEAAVVTERKLARDEAERHRAALDAWLRREQLTDQLTEIEQSWIEAPIGKLPEDDFRDASWSAEGLAVLLWALGVSNELPPDGAEVPPGEVMERVPAVGSEVLPFVSAARLRPRDEIAAAAARAEARYDDECGRQFGAATASVPLSIALERRRAFVWLGGAAAQW
jgi:hypothetical protein